MGTGKPLNTTINIFGMVYLPISAADQEREGLKFPGGPVDVTTAAGSHTVVTQKA